MATKYNTYVSGTLVRTTAVFINVDGAVTDPGTVTVKVQGPDGVTTPSATKDSTGNYHYDIDTSGWTGPGNCTYWVEWIGTGAVKAVNNDKFFVSPPMI